MGATCGANCGITRERDRQRAEARSLARRHWPDGVRGAPVAWPETLPVDDDEVSRIVGQLEGALPCSVFVVEAEGPWAARWLWLVPTVAGESWAGFREGLCEAPPEGASEVALRVGLSGLGRYATLQQCSLTVSLEAGGTWIEERRCAGVEDRRLQLFVKATQGLLRKAKVVCLDAAFLAEPLDQGGEAEGLWNALFDPDPMTVTVGTWAPDTAPPRSALVAGGGLTA